MPGPNKKILLCTIDFGVMSQRHEGKILPAIYEIQPMINPEENGTFTGHGSQYFSVFGQSSQHSKRACHLNTQRMCTGLNMQPGQYSLYSGSGPLLNDKLSQRELLKEKQPDLCPKYTTVTPNKFNEEDLATHQKLIALWDDTPWEEQSEPKTKSFVIKIPGYSCGQGNIFLDGLTTPSQFIQKVSEAIKEQSIRYDEKMYGFKIPKVKKIKSIDTPILIEQCINQGDDRDRAVYRVTAVCNLDTKEVKVMPTTVWPLLGKKYNSHQDRQNYTCFDLIQRQIYPAGKLAQPITSPEYAKQLEHYNRIFKQTEASICSMLQSMVGKDSEHLVSMTITIPDELLEKTSNGYATFSQVCNLHAGDRIYSQVDLKHGALNIHHMPHGKVRSCLEKKHAFNLLLEAFVTQQLDSDYYYNNLDEILNSHGQKIRKLILHYEFDDETSDPSKAAKQKVRDNLPCMINRGNFPKFFAKVQAHRIQKLQEAEALLQIMGMEQEMEMGSGPTRRYRLADDDEHAEDTTLSI